MHSKMSYLPWMDLLGQFLLSTYLNKVKGLELAKENIGKNFGDVVWTDEYSIQLSSHCRFCCQKKVKDQRKNKTFFMACFIQMYLHRHCLTTYAYYCDHSKKSYTCGSHR